MKDNVPSNCVVRQNFTDVYNLCTEIGRGKFAVVKRCTHRASGQEYAAKFLKKRRKGVDCRRNILNEIRMLELSVNHPQIISIIEVFETNHDLVIVTDFAKGGELFEYINVEGHVDETLTVRLLRQILNGLVFLHNNNIAHLDIKPQNVLLTEPLPKGDIKLCDFGLARDFNCGQDVLEIIGTLDYVAPEVLDYKPLNSTCDMWSVGVLTYVMLTGCVPFAGNTNQETFLNISQVNLDFPEDLFVNISTEATDFISKLLLKDQEERMTAQQSLEHRWLQAKELTLTCHVNTLSAGSPSGQRQSMTLTNDLIYHEPIKKFKCNSTSHSTIVVATKTKVHPKDHPRRSVTGSTEGSVSVATEGAASDAWKDHGTVSLVTLSKKTTSREPLLQEIVSQGTVSLNTLPDDAISDETLSQLTASQETLSKNSVSQQAVTVTVQVVNYSTIDTSIAKTKNFESENENTKFSCKYAETVVQTSAKNRVKDNSGNCVKENSGNCVKGSSGNCVKDSVKDCTENSGYESSGNWFKDSSENRVKESSGNWVNGNKMNQLHLEHQRDMTCRISA